MNLYTGLQNLAQDEGFNDRQKGVAMKRLFEGQQKQALAKWEADAALLEDFFGDLDKESATYMSIHDRRNPLLDDIVTQRSTMSSLIGLVRDTTEKPFEIVRTESGEQVPRFYETDMQYLIHECERLTELSEASDYQMLTGTEGNARRSTFMRTFMIGKLLGGATGFLLTRGKGPIARGAAAAGGYIVGGALGYMKSVGSEARLIKNNGEKIIERLEFIEECRSLAYDK